MLKALISILVRIISICVFTTFLSLMFQFYKKKKAMKLYLFLYIICASFYLSVACHNAQSRMVNIAKMVSSIEKQSKNFEFKCNKKGIDCASFSCDVLLKKSDSSAVLFSISGSWLCKQNEMAFRFKFVSELSRNNNATLTRSRNATKFSTVNNDTLAINMDFGDQIGTKQNLTLNMTVRHSELKDVISAKLLDVTVICNCININLLENQIKGVKDDVRCWSLNSKCLSFYCMVAIPSHMIHYNFEGSLSCPNGSPEYKLDQVIHYNNSEIAQPFDMTFNSTDAEETFSKVLESNIKKKVTVSINSTFIDISKGNLTLNSDVIFKQVSNSIWEKNIKIAFQNPGCQVPPSTKEPTETTTGEKPATEKPATEKSTTEKPQTEKPPIEKPPTIEAPSMSKTHVHSSSPAKTVLIVLAVLIILSVFLVALYLKKKRRLRNQPAYYNDIALNDPLRYEIEGEQHDEDDDDELPLFS